MADLPAKPASREEEYLASMAGMAAEVPPCPRSRKEAYLEAIDGRIEALDQEIQEIENNPDVADIVDTYADLMAYDTSTLTDKDIIRVLNDETHNNESTYYRYSEATDSWTYIGSTGPKGGGVQSDWAEDDSTDPAYIKNRPFYDEKVVSEIPQASATTAGSTPDADYVWFVEQLIDYSLTSELSDFEDGDIVFAKISYSVDGVEKSDTGKFILNIENNLAELDYDAPAGTRWAGAYISEVNAGDTTVRWPVASSDASATVYIASIEYTKVKQLDAQYIPVDGDTVKVNADGELEADVQGGPTVVQTTGTSTTDVMSQNATTSMVFADPDNKRIIGIGRTKTNNDGDYSVAIGISSVAVGVRSVAIGTSANAGGERGVAIGPSANAGGERGVAIGGEYVSAALQDAIVIGCGTSATAVSASVGGISIGGRSWGQGRGSISLGYGSYSYRQGEMNIGTSLTAYGYDNSNYRLLTGLYDPQTAHDAATKGYVDTQIGSIDTALQTLLNGTGA